MVVGNTHGAGEKKFKWIKLHLYAKGMDDTIAMFFFTVHEFQCASM